MFNINYWGYGLNNDGLYMVILLHGCMDAWMHGCMIA
jgi:hypothetical protein